MSRRTITFNKNPQPGAAPSQIHNGVPHPHHERDHGHSTSTLPDQGHHDHSQQSHKEQQPDVLRKERPEPAYHPGQDLPDERRRQKQVGTLRHGYERLGHMYSLGIPFKFEELQGRHPFDFVKETKEHYKLHPDPVKKPAQPEDTTLFDVREWLEPLLRKGQLYWDYCRDKWVEKESQLGSACAPICCIYSLWSVTDSCLQYGGLVFMAVYLFLTIVFIIPFIYMEMTIGQFHRQGVVKAVQQTCPLFQGLAYLMLLSSLFDYLLSMTRLSWLFYYLFSSISTEPPWRTCDQYWSSKECKETPDHDSTAVYSTDEKTPAVEWYRSHVIRPWNHWEVGQGTPSAGEVIVGLLPNFKILIAFLILILLFRQTMKLWCRPLGTLLIVIFWIAFMCFAFPLIVYHHTFTNDVDYALSDWLLKSEQLYYFYDKDTWTNAIRHAVIGSGIGTGMYITFGSHNTFPNDDIKRMSVLSGMASFGIHFMVAAFFLLSHFTIKTTSSFRTASEDNYGRDLFFEKFPQVCSQHHQPGMGYIMFFGIISGLILLASLRVLSALHTLRQHFIDQNKEFYEPCRVNYNYWEHDKIKRQQRYIFLHLSPKRKGQLMTKIMLYSGIFHVLTFFAGGSEILFVAEAFWYSYIPIFVIMVECIAVFFLAGVRTLNEYVRKMTTRQVTLWYRFAWKTFIPLIPIVYMTHPPRPVGNVGGVPVPFKIHLIGYVCAGFPLFFMYVSVLHTWRKSRAKRFCNKFLLEVTPQHEHPGMIAGRKPSTRLHWMHHLQVPAGISRGLCLPPYEGPPQKPDPTRFQSNNCILNFLWFNLRLRWFNNFNMCIEHPTEEDRLASNFHMFPAIPFPMKPPKKQIPFPEYLPNQAIKRVHKLKKYKDFQKHRKFWLNEKVELEQERMAGDHDERDIESGILPISARQAREEDEEREFFDMFDSTEDERWETTSTESSEDSFDASSDDGRGKVSSPSVSTSETFDSQDSIFKLSEEEYNLFSKPTKSQQDLESTSEEEEEDKPEELIDDFEEKEGIIAPQMDYEEGEGVPFDDETDSWDLEAMEDLEEDKGIDDNQEEETGTTDVETDTDDLIEALNESGMSEEDEESEDSDTEEENEEKPEDNNKPRMWSFDSKEGGGDGGSEESNSWSISCGSDESSCTDEDEDDSEDDDDDDDDDSDDDDDDDGDDKGDSDEEGELDKDKNSDESIPHQRKTKRNIKLKMFRTMAETLDTFLHISKKTEKDRIGEIRERVDRAKRDERKDAP